MESDFPYISIGIHHSQADLSVRSQFSLSVATQTQLLEEAQKRGLRGLLVLSTCNRTELHAVHTTSEALTSLLFSVITTPTSQQIWRSLSWRKGGLASIRHLLRVGSGLDSGVLGDLQIISQIKKSHALSQQILGAHAHMERWVNTTIYVSKRIKNETGLSDGAASTSYIAVNQIKSWSASRENLTILILGAGEIGKVTCHNIVTHLPLAKLSLCNRSIQHVNDLAERYNLPVKPWEDKDLAIRESDVIITATGAPSAVVMPETLYGGKKQLFLDLSVPTNIDQHIADIDGKTLMNLDHLMSCADQTLGKRKQSIPLAENILDEEQMELCNWLEFRKYSPMIKLLKEELGTIHQQEFEGIMKKNPTADRATIEQFSDVVIRKVTARIAHFLQVYRPQGEAFREAVHAINPSINQTTT